MNASARPAVIKAVYVNWKTVTTRDALQLVFEVPLEAQAEVLNILGAPRAAESIWCAIALLQQPPENAEVESPIKEKDKWADMKPCKQAILAAKGARFQDFAVVMLSVSCDEEGAARFIRHNCNIGSRSELNTDTGAADLWHRLYEDYRQWSGMEAEQRG